MKMEQKKISYPCSDKVCSTCLYQSECAANDWCLFDEQNKDCPNYDEGKKQFKFFIKEYLDGKFD